MQEDILVSATGEPQEQAPELESIRGFSPSVQAHEVDFRGFAAVVSAEEEVEVNGGGALVMASGDELEINGGGAMLIAAGGHATINGGGAQLLVSGGSMQIRNGGGAVMVAGGEGKVDDGFVGVLISGNTTLSNGSRVLLSTPQALAFGAGLGLALAIVGRLLRGK